MKIKTLLVCFLAVATIALSSCGKEKDYAADFVGNYEVAMSGEISLTIGEVSQDVPFDTDESYFCSITRVGDDNNVTVTITDGETPFFISNAVCDETGMNLNGMTFEETISDEEIGEIGVNLSLGSTTVSAPVNGNIYWTSSLTGTVSMNMMGFPVESEVEGSLTFAGKKQN